MHENSKALGEYLEEFMHAIDGASEAWAGGRLEELDSALWNLDHARTSVLLHLKLGRIDGSLPADGNKSPAQFAATIQDAVEELTRLSMSMRPLPSEYEPPPKDADIRMLLRRIRERLPELREDIRLAWLHIKHSCFYEEIGKAPLLPLDQLSPGDRPASFLVKQYERAYAKQEAAKKNESLDPLPAIVNANDARDAELYRMACDGTPYKEVGKWLAANGYRRIGEGGIRAAVARYCKRHRVADPLPRQAGRKTIRAR